MNKSSLTFTTVNYATNQRVTVTAGQDADAADGTANLTHQRRRTAPAKPRTMVTVDDTAGLVLSATTLGVDEAGQAYTVKLQTQPTTTVTVTVSSDDTGAATATVSGSTLIFTASNWETEQTVTVEGVDDGDSANETVTVTNTASGGEYEGVTASVRVTVDDDDKPGITFTPTSLTVGEAGVGTYGVRLNAAPTADVTVAISSSNPDVTVNTSSLTFTTVNYATNQRVDVTAAEDADAADDTANLRHRPSGGGYGSGQNKDLIVTVTDYDTAGLMLSTPTLGVDEGGQAAYTVKLQTQPTTTVTVTVSSGDTGAATVSGPTLRFTPSNWETEQTVTVRGVNDGDSTDDVTITHTASGGEYAGVMASVTVTVDDDDTRGITFTPAARTIREGATGTYDVKLNTAPTADVTVAISSDNADVTVNKSSLTFTTVNYATNQRVTVTAGQDADAADGTANLTHRPSGGDYSAGEAKDFMVTVTDDDTAGLVLSATTLGVDEAGQAAYTVKLQTQPTTTVTVTVSSDDTGAATATVSGSTLIFTASNWETEQTVTVEGVDDGDSANETVTVTNTASGGEYEGVTASVRVTVDDDDKPGITFTPASLTVGEAGVGTYGVRLNAAPSADVTVAISSSNPDVTVNTSSLTFTTVNYATNQRVDVTAAEDADAADDTANLRHHPSGGGYGSGQNKDLIVTVTDYDTARLELSVWFLDVDEGGQAAYTVKLQTQPTTTVTVTVSSDDTDAATVSGPTLRFTTSNWDTEQTVTVRGVNDGDSDGEFVTITNTASGGEYAGVTETVWLFVDDDDKPGITFTPAARTIREGATGTYDVKLNTAPTADVTVAISSDNADVTVNKSSLTFTTVNYATNQRVTVTAGQDADAADGTANLTHRPSGGDYSAGEAKDFMVTVTDDDTAGLVLSATTLGVDEAGQNTYTVKLQTQPTTTVTVTVSSDDTGAATATVSGSTLIFTASNWETEQTVTVEGVDDGDSANETVTVTNTASGGEYEGVTASVRVTVDDDDKPGITFTPTSLTVGEAGVGTYGVRLNAAPTADVTVAISSSNPDVTVNTSSLTFTTVNYATNQRVDVTAAEDADAADDTANLRHRPSGGGYGSGQNKDLIVTVTDYDTAGLMLSTPTLGVDEGGQAAYTVKLQTQPTTTVTVTVSSGDTGAATVSGPTLRFTPSNWDTEQTVTVRGVNDGDSDGEIVTITHTASGGEYAGVTASVTVTVDDDDTRGITFTPAARTIREGATGTYDVKLNTAPTADVTVAISSDNADVTVNKSSLTFTTVNYATNQRVTVTAGQDADAADGTANLTHRPSGGDYSAGEAKDFMVTVTDDDTAGLVLSATTLGVDEAGQNTYTVKLQTQPTTTVTVTVSSDDTGAATATVSGSTLIFTASNWETEQTVTVEGVDDGDSANETVTVTNTASGGEYEGVTASVRVTVDDDDKPGITFTPTSLTVGEAGVGTYGVRLNAAPTADVTVAISSSNPDVTVNTSSLTFTTVNYATNQRVDVTAAEDADAADDTANLRHRPSGGGYGSGQNKDLIVTVTDYDTAGLMLSTPTLGVDEGGQAAYTVKLQTQPTTTVTVTVSSGDTGAATVSGPTLRFTPSNWDTEQTVTVRGVNDGDSTDEIVTITHTASGGEYAGVTASVTVTVDDDDTRGITFTPAARTIREGATGTYDVKLNTAPTADVTVAISSDNADVTVNKSSLTFTTVNYATNQRVTVTAGQDADAADGTANLTHRPSGGGYSAGEAKDFMVTVTDDDTAGLVLSATTLGVDEAGQNTYTVKLQTQPTTTVTVTVSSDDTGAATATVSGSTLIFTASNWETEQTVTVEGVDDGDSANETVTVTNTASGGEYEGVTASVRVTVDDDDKPGITFTPASLTVGEAGVGTYGVRLNAAPTADVTVAISSSNPDVTVNTSSLTFTTVNYATNQRVDVTAAEDADAADDTANLRHRPSGGGYGSGQNKDLIVTVTDYDTARLELSVWFLDVDEGGQAAYTVKLQTQPTTTVTVTVSSGDTDAATVSGPTLRFTTSNWDTEQTVTVRGVNDGDSDGEFVTITNTASGGEYAGVTETVWLFVDDDDKPGITFTPAARTIREGATGTYDVKLNTAPTADVTVAISSDNPDVTVNKSSLTFTTVNYATNQRVTVTAGQDADAADGTANLTHRPSGGDYSAGEAKDFMVTVTDDDTAGLVLSATTLGVDEAGQNTYTVKLQTQPTTTVTVTVSSDDTGAATATVSGSTLIFTASNWETEQTVTVEGVDDGDSANETVTVTNTASGGEYEGVTASVRVTVDDDDKPGITFTPTSLTVGEAGVGTYGVRLNAAPTADVTVAISSSNPDVTVNTSSLTFTTVNYATNQRVDVTAAEDADAADDTANLRHRPSGGGYGSGQNKDLIVTVTDYDTAGLMLSTPTLGVDEGGQAAYTVKLQTQPTTTVTVTVSSGDTGAATVSGPTLRFTPSNWDTEQTVTVRGVNDGDSDGEIVTITHTASGGEYAGVTASVTVTVDDDDTPGITFTPAARTIREGATGTYDVKLNTAPTADVTVAISSDNADVTVNKSSLTFTTVNYATNQRVTVTAGQDADAADGTANLTHRPSGGGYSAGEAKDFMVTVTDDDTAGLVLSATTLGVDEAGQNTYTVKLQTQPTTTVTVTVSSDDTGAATATVSGSTLIFTASNWETEQTVTVEGVDDGDSANETVTVTNTASGGEYEGVTASVRVTVDDDDKPGITFTPTSLTVGEAGVGTYGVRLNAAPTADVTVAISSSNPDVTVNTSSLTFTTVNYATNQRVDVTAAEDADAADDTANLRHRPSGGGYGSGQNKDLIVTVTDYDTAGLMLSTPTLGVDEGGQAAYTVKLQTQPTTTVTVTVSSGDTGAATVSGPTLRFTPSNWETEQTVTVRGVNDGDSTDEIVTITHTASGGEYAGVTASVTVTVDDDDTPGITFTPAARTIREGATGTYDVKLNTAPTADVTVAISSDNADVTVNKSSLTFTTVNYATNQRVTVTAGQDADAADGTANLTHRPSGGDYSAGEAKDFMVTVTDDDTAGLVLSATTLGVDEAGQNTYTVKLQTQPTTTVTVTVSSDDTGAATATVSGSTLIFTASNWETEQTVTVEGVDDGDSANETVTVTNTASGGEYEGVTASVRVTVDDDDKPGITFTPTSLTVGEAGVGTYGVRLNAAPTADVTVAISSSNPDVTVNTSSLTFTTVNYATNQRVDVTAAEDADAADDTANLRHRPSGGGYGSGQNKDLIVTVTDYDTAGLMLSTPTLGVDEGGQAAYTVKLQTQPTTTVTVTVSSGDTGAATVSGPTLRFTPSNWDTEQTVTVRGVNDGDSTDEIVTITNTASGGEYAGVTASVTVTVDDDDTRGITFTPAARTIREGATGTYDVKLNTAPTADVTVAISSDNADVTVNKSSLTFTTVNYATNQRVTVTAGQDADAADGTANLTHRPTGGDYSAGEAKDFMVTVTDDDTAGLVLSATTLGVDEAGQNTYTVKLQTQPTTTVTVTVSSDDTGAATATVSGSTLIFTASNWETEQTVTVEGVDDGDSANETVTVTNTASGGEYEGVTASVRVTVDDDDKPGITFTPTSLTVGEAGVGTYGVRLNAAPTADVTVAISSSNPDVTVNTSSLTFTTVNYATNQRVDVTAAEDADAADDTANLRHRPSGGGYGSGQNKDLIVTVTDYDTGLMLSTPTLGVDEGGQAAYTELQTQPTTTVTVKLTRARTGPTLRFTPSNTRRSPSASMTADRERDHTASGGEYAGVTASVTVTVDDDDTPGITFTPAARTIREGATGTYDVKLNTAPTADVTVAISSDNADVTVNKSSLTFTTVNYATNQRVTVTAGQDADAADGTANLTHRPTGGDYSAGEAKDFMVTVTDDDTAGLVLSPRRWGWMRPGRLHREAADPAHHHVTVTVSSDDTGAATATRLHAHLHRVELGDGADGHRRGRR